MPKRPSIRSAWAALAVAIFLAAAGNLRLWGALIGGPEPLSWTALVAVFLAIVAVFGLLLQIVAVPWIFKPIAGLLLMAAAAATVFMLGYGVLIDRSMVGNALQTVAAEAAEFVTPRNLLGLLGLGVLPVAALCWARLRYGPLRSELRLKAGLVAGTTAAALAFAWPSFQDLSFAARRSPELKLMLNPSSPIGSLISYLHGRSHAAAALTPIATDASRRDEPGRRRTVFVLVLGETATAAHFSLNGYERDTNPELSTRQVVNFPDVTACATSTADALPRIFSGLTREECSDLEFDLDDRETLLDVLQRVGVSVLWKDNNSGCKGVCERVRYEEATGPPELQHDGAVYDEALLVGLQAELDRQPGDLFLVLHQKGSHGPAYYRRSPPAFKRFLPECSGDDVQRCPRDEVVNAYDNTILYTDHVLAMVIDFLAANSATSQVAMLYVSDHGESLGENGIYLHGFPYWLAPYEQTHVPMLFWASPEFYEAHGQSLVALRAASGRPYSHDNVFHTILGAFDVQTASYDASLDLLEPAPRS